MAVYVSVEFFTEWYVPYLILRLVAYVWFLLPIKSQSELSPYDLLRITENKHSAFEFEPR